MSKDYLKNSPMERWRRAISVLAPGSRYDSKDNTIINWKTPDIPQPSEEEIQTLVDEYAADWATTEYSRNRRWEYPDWGDQLNKIYDDGLTKWKSEMVDPVKTKWPKDNSGPVE